MYSEILILLWLHFVGDFVLQSDTMATKKSRSLKWLGIHSLCYSIPMLFFGLEFAILAGVSHFLVDFITSMGTSYFHRKGERHWFFTTIGLDQVIHSTILINLLQWI